MAKSPLTGARIRSYRADSGMRQASLAKQCGISPSYLNLIEHNRRRIGGALLLKIAEVLDVDPSVLSGGAEVALASAVDTAAEAHPEIDAERQRAEELAGRFPGWARLIEKQHKELRRLEQVVEQLSDRLTHDPFLSASMHNVLSSVTAIRSASAILAQGGDIEREWQDRFHRNIYEDSQRLAEATETLVGYLDRDERKDSKATLPQDEIDAWMGGRRWCVEELEINPDAELRGILSGGSALVSASAKRLAERMLARYAADVRAVPRDRLLDAIAESGADPAALAHRFGVEIPCVFRRLATLSAENLPDDQLGPYGLVAADASGTLVFRKAVDGFDMPRYGSACPLWPLFQSLARPMVPIVQNVAMSGRDEAGYETTAVSYVTYPGGIDRPAVVEAWMLIKPLLRPPEGAKVLHVGPSCRVCSKADCLARREPSVFGFEAAPEALTG